MKTTNKILTLIFVSAASTLMPLSAATILWDESFDDTTFDSGWAIRGAGGTTISQNDGLIMLPGTSTSSPNDNFARRFLATQVTQGQTAGGTPATFNGNPAYNFFNHDLVLSFSGISIPSDVTAGSLIFYSGITGNSQTSNEGPRGGQPGAFLRMQQTTSSLQLGLMEASGIPLAASRTFNGKDLSGAPTGVTLSLSATGWTIDITGTTFTDTTTSHTGTWTDDFSSSIFDTHATLIVGSYNESVATWDSGNNNTPITLGGMTVTAIPEPSAALLGGLAGLLLLRRRRA